MGGVGEEWHGRSRGDGVWGRGEASKGKVILRSQDTQPGVQVGGGATEPSPGVSEEGEW